MTRYTCRKIVINEVEDEGVEGEARAKDFMVDSKIEENEITRRVRERVAV